MENGKANSDDEYWDNVERESEKSRLKLKAQFDEKAYREYVKDRTIYLSVIVSAIASVVVVMLTVLFRIFPSC